MSAIVLDMTPRPSRYVATRYSAFRLDNGRSCRLQIGDPESLQAAVDAAKMACLHKEHLAILVEDEAGSRVHLYAIKRKSQPSYEFRDHAYHRVHTLYADPVCIMDAAMFRLNEEAANDPDPEDG